MFLASFPTGPLAANCYLVAADLGSAEDNSRTDCVVVDPGMESAEKVESLVQEHRLRPVAVLVSHGHADHSADAARVADAYRAGCWLAEPDRGQLAEPLSGLSPQLRPAFAGLLDPPSGRAVPARMLDLAPGPVSLAGMDFRLLPAPGHTPGSTLFALSSSGPGPSTVVFTGDVVFVGSIGRTDLPGGDPSAMQHTLRQVVLGLPDDAVLLPGHGPQTTVGRERATNPYLQD